MRSGLEGVRTAYQAARIETRWPLDTALLYDEGRGAEVLFAPYLSAHYFFSYASSTGKIATRIARPIGANRCAELEVVIA